MKSLKFCSFLLLLCVVKLAEAQKSPFKFGEISTENLEMMKNPLDSSAGALILLDFGKTTFDHNFQIVLEHHIRIKIFNSSEFDRATVKIPYATDDRVERLKAATYNLVNGKIVESKLSKKDIYEEKVNDNVKQKRFSLPDVKEGTIIEYTYQVNYGSWMSLNPWYFQTSVPVLHSEYIVSLPEYFDYKKIMSGYVILSDHDISTKVGHYGSSTFNMTVQKFVAKNVPAFKEEPYMTTKDDYISKIQFELSNINIPGTLTKRYMPYSYEELSKNYAESESFGKKLTKNKFLTDEIERITSDLTDSKAKIEAIYHYVRDNFEVDREVQTESLRKIFNLKKGYPQDINMLLIAMYNEAGFESNAVRLSTRSNGMLHPLYAIASNFNYTICVVKDGENEYLLDPSKKYLPFNTLDKNCLNGRGMVVTAQNFRWVDLYPSTNNKKQVFASLELSEEGSLKGAISLSRVGYEAIEFREDHKKDVDGYKKTFSEAHTTWVINNHEIEGIDIAEEALTEKIDIELDAYAETMGDIIYLTPIFYGRIVNNPLKSPERLYPVNYGTPIEELVTCRIKVPEGYVIDEKPDPLAIGLPNNGGAFIYNVQQIGDYISVTSKFNIKKIEFSAEEYQYLREFYTQVIAKQAEQVVLKKNG
ncbi:hypothetical protein C900_04628 [Fulvivirga imtechensis AK7]|uniref:DUF3857 domain-containing protein n=1 Tax=Fulvivirga imtechensis AK7 TaxID=1237149 RepID=L8JLI7_9BACT|nr:DUF3857 and transglutaminase domain-containing protein [Fulvivirga imtechensis]ELR69781.1 hypothetical protein C900_04628 [Fulvivirga imtechensis AK7]